MRKVQTYSAWVVYRMNVDGKASGPTGVCGQEEWAVMQATQFGQHTLIRDGITTEKEAEQVARGTSGDSFSSRTVRKN